MKSCNIIILSLYHNLSYGEILSGQPGAWLVKIICFLCMKSQQFRKGLHFGMISSTGFVFLVAFTVHELCPVSNFIMMTATTKNGWLTFLWVLSFKLNSRILIIKVWVIFNRNVDQTASYFFLNGLKPNKYAKCWPKKGCTSTHTYNQQD